MADFSALEYAADIQGIPSNFCHWFFLCMLKISLLFCVWINPNLEYMWKSCHYVTCRLFSSTLWISNPWQRNIHVVVHSVNNSADSRRKQYIIISIIFDSFSLRYGWKKFVSFCVSFSFVLASSCFQNMTSAPAFPANLVSHEMPGYTWKIQRFFCVLLHPPKIFQNLHSGRQEVIVIHKDRVLPEP